MMAYRKFKQVFVAAAMAACASGASSAVVTMSATADLSLANLIGGNTIQAGAYFGNAAALPLTSPVTVATGDTFVLNLDFLGNQQLTVNNLNLAWALVLTQGYGQGSTITMTGTMELLGADNSVVASATKTNTDGSIHISQVFFGGEFGSPASVTFAGLRYTGVVNAQDVNPRTYDGPSLYFTGSQVSVGTFVSNDVPEPGSLALGLLALAAAGSASRRRPAAPGSLRP